MIFEGQNAVYEVIQTLPETGGNLHYRCRRQGKEMLCHLAGAPLGEDILSRVAVWQENPAFADLMDYVILEDRIYLVFPDPSGSALCDVLETMTPLQRFSVGQQVMEHFLIQDMPLCLQWGLACPEAVYVEADGSKLCFFYLLEAVTEYGGITKEAAAAHLYELFEILFSGEICDTCPETAAFLEHGTARDSMDLMAVYTEYLGLLPAFSRIQNGTGEEEKEKETLVERLKKLWKKWSKILLSGVKVALGVMTLCAALILLPQVWEEKISPVLDGMMLWKQVYVDGETLPLPEAGLSQEEDGGAENGGAENNGIENDGSETGGEDAAGRKTLYWENGSIRYQGGMLDDQYEGAGTLYYADGSVEYQGTFSFGKRNGEGTSYTDTGLLLYEGQFGNDRYEGEGRLYDKEYGSLLYEGGFQSGKYSGEGTLYQPLSDFPLYVGGFRLGHYDGKGLQYDENGCMLYEGDFLLGIYHGNGTIYDPETGVVLFAGAFRNGMPVLTDGMGEGELLPRELGEGELLPGELGEGELLPGELDEAGLLQGEVGEGELPQGKLGEGESLLGGAGENTPLQNETAKGTNEAANGEPLPVLPEMETPDGKSPVIGPVGETSQSTNDGPGVLPGIPRKEDDNAEDEGLLPERSV